MLQNTKTAVGSGPAWTHEMSGSSPESTGGRILLEVLSPNCDWTQEPRGKMTLTLGKGTEPVIGGAGLSP